MTKTRSPIIQLLILTVLFNMTGITISSAAKTDSNDDPGIVTLVLNGSVLHSDVDPIIVDGRTLIPARAVFEKLGGEVGWYEWYVPQQVTVAYSGIRVNLMIGSNIAKVNGIDTFLDVPAQIVNSRTLIPVRFVSESLNFKVDWDDDTRTVSISTPEYLSSPKSVTIDKMDIISSDTGTNVIITAAGIMPSYRSFSEPKRFIVEINEADFSGNDSAVEWYREISAIRSVSVTKYLIPSQAANPDEIAPNSIDHNAALTQNNQSSNGQNGTSSTGQEPVTGQSEIVQTDQTESSVGYADDDQFQDSEISPDTTSGGINSEYLYISTSGMPDLDNEASKYKVVSRFIFDLREDMSPIITLSNDRTALNISFPAPTKPFDPWADGKLSVILDPGHGVETSGKRSPDGTLREYEFNRDMANRVKAHLDRHGIEVLFTVYDDSDMSLSERCRVANESVADVFVSLHANAIGNKIWSPVTGWEVYVYRKGSYSEQLASAIHMNTIPSSGLKDRGVKAERFYVIRNTSMPSVLIEHGFYTNQTEVELLKSSAFREQLAVMDTMGILEFLGVDWIPL